MITDVLGELKIEVPMPSTSIRHMNSIGCAPLSSIASESSAPLTKIKPSVVSGREPSRSDSVPETGEISSIATGIGMIISPASNVL